MIRDVSGEGSGACFVLQCRRVGGGVFRITRAEESGHLSRHGDGLCEPRQSQLSSFTRRYPALCRSYEQEFMLEDAGAAMLDVFIVRRRLNSLDRDGVRALAASVP